MMPENWYTALLKRKATSGNRELVRQYGAWLYSRRLTAPSGLRVEPAAGLTPWAGRVLPVIGFALQAGGGLTPSGVIKHRCASDVGAFRRHDKYRLTAENCREAAYKMAPQAPYLASAAVLYNSLGRRP